MSLSSVGTAGSLSNLSTVYKDTPFDKCPRCRAQFDFLKRINVTKVPLILPCKHTVCEDCIKKLVSTNNTVCPVCKHDFEASRTDVDNLSYLFPPHYSLIGQLVWAKNSPNRRNMNFVSTGFTLGNKYSDDGIDMPEYTPDTNAKGSEASDDDGDKITLSFVFDKCIEHSDQFVNVRCDQCDETYCCYCFIENHTGHKATYLYKLDKSELAELEMLKTDIEVILRQLLVSTKQVKDLKTCHSSNVELDIKNYFAFLHAKLHLAERSIRKKLTNIEVEVGDLEVVNSSLKSRINRVNQVLAHFNLLNTKQLNLRALYEEAKDIRGMSCRLTTDQEGIRPIEFLQEDVFDDVEDSICLKTLPYIEYSLVPIEDWSQAQEKYELDQMRKQTELRNQSEPRTESKEPRTESKQPRIESKQPRIESKQPRIESKQPRIESKQPTTETKQPRTEIIKIAKRTENETKKSTDGKFRAIVTHINNLNSFFIQKYSALHYLKEMNTAIGRRTKKRGATEEYKIGGIYGVLYETKNSSHWRRGKLIDMLPNEENVMQYKIFFFDYGNTQLVSGDKFKILDIRTITRPPFSFECKLTNPEQITFEPNAHLHLPDLIGEKELYVCFLEKSDSRVTVKEVDLFLTTSNGTFVSIKDLLVKSPVIVTPPIDKKTILCSQLKFFQNSKQFSNGDETSVVVTYVRNPFCICVQLAQNIKLIEKMNREMLNFYKDKPVISCIPVADTDVIVKYNDANQGIWHRAKIMSVDIANKEVDVYFVDWGYSTVVSWSNLRLLVEQFIKVECQGIIVKLAAIEKLNMSEPWGKEVTTYLRECLDNNECRMLISNAENLEVVLFQSRSAADICINALLVEKKYAISMGPLSSTVYWPNMEANVTEDDDDFSVQMVKKSREVIVAEEDVHLKSGKKLQVSVVNFQSPDLIYIKFNQYKEIEDELHKELQIHYSSFKSKTRSTWKVGENCVVFDSVGNSYFRAIIKSSYNSGNHIVYLYDHARELKVSRKCIFVQNSYFDKYLCYVCKCRLSNIKPAGDAGKWSNLAIEMLQKIFATHKTIYVKKLEINEQDKILGVIMWYCLTTPAKALEPSKVKYISINQSLIESGVAFVSSSMNGTNDNKAEKEVECEEKDERNEDKKAVNDKNEDVHETKQTTWPQPFEIEFSEFDAILTCVDNEGHFSIRSLEIDKYYQELETNLTRKLSSFEATTDTQWRTNDMCTILFEGKWYRGTVLDVLNDEEISVEMIDFGSEHLVPKDQLTKLIMFPDIPPLINKVELYDVYSKSGRWSFDDVNMVLSLASDNVRVVIEKDIDADVPQAEIYLEGGLSLNDLIVQKCPHMSRRKNKVSLGNFVNVESDDENDNKEEEDVVNVCTDFDKSYKYVCLSPQSTKKQKLFIISILKLDNCYNAVLSTKNCNNLDELIGLDEIQTAAVSQPSLQNIEINEPCICMHFQKKVWSRALIYKINSLKYGFVSAFFVDYGTVEMVPVNGLKTIRQEWLDIPVYMQIATINIELLQSNQAEFVLMQLNALRGSSILVEVVSEEPLKVHLYDEDNNLIYKDLIDCGIVKAL